MNEYVDAFERRMYKLNNPSGEVGVNLISSDPGAPKGVAGQAWIKLPDESFTLIPSMPMNPPKGVAGATWAKETVDKFKLIPSGKPGESFATTPSGGLTPVSTPELPPKPEGVAGADWVYNPQANKWELVPSKGVNKKFVPAPGGGLTTGPSTPPPPVATPAGPTLARNVFVQTLGQFFPGVDANAGWLGDLYDVVSGYYKSGTTLEQSFNLALRDAKTNPKLATFANRFKAIADLEALKAQGKPIIVPTIAEYVTSETSVADLMREANLGDIATPETIGSILGKGNSVSTIASKINQVFNRIDRAPQVIKDTLSRYFPTVDRNTLARTLLLGEKGVQQLQDELAGLEVLAAGEKQGIGATAARPGGLTQQRAQEYARAGISFAEAMPKFAEVAQATPVEEKLAGISKKKSIGQAGVEQALVLGSAEELRKLEEAAAEEQARFRAKSGRLEPGLASQRRANRAF